MIKYLHCRSCDRSTEAGPNSVDTVIFLEQEWCARCARVEYTHEQRAYVRQPSPGRMVIGPTNDPLDIWMDCYKMKPKNRIKVAEAKHEIQRAWVMWDGDKDASGAKLIFFGWLRRMRPYFLTFRGREDPWQRVNRWLSE